MTLYPVTFLNLPVSSESPGGVYRVFCTWDHAICKPGQVGILLKGRVVEMKCQAAFPSIPSVGATGEMSSHQRASLLSRVGVCLCGCTSWLTRVACARRWLWAPLGLVPVSPWPCLAFPVCICLRTDFLLPNHFLSLWPTCLSETTPPQGGVHASEQTMDAFSRQPLKVLTHESSCRATGHILLILGLSVSVSVRNRDETTLSGNSKQDNVQDTGQGQGFILERRREHGSLFTCLLDAR